ncbi:hypothetical protein CAOG_05864 [Capsaspora owczarzaki ATCC 30864]|uniref:Uncharacterized protein n=1 Tax=Capsaspora owczarzaki (strain ATCC 30864) TaxID=595528 RepID=A0A0D2WSW0_CAPO3|nr:hypothetical protein CAOG_05864 [Capsaspora owczarzaki ATCC 30864]KJE95410.1 hypothetical protein CAOG_005864 [Capsaspora owczarzaki ATCC 30864]|eukprot:XP_004345454.2 hypothetical protein CAOG_05864 [Capsaspora owczarzaki ATCC 30864]
MPLPSIRPRVMPQTPIQLYRFCLGLIRHMPPVFQRRTRAIVRDMIVINGRHARPQDVPRLVREGVDHMESFYLVFTAKPETILQLFYAENVLGSASAASSAPAFKQPDQGRPNETTPMQ